MTAPFFAPLAGLQVGRSGTHTVRRAASVVSTPGGISHIRTFAKGPVGLHPVVVECNTAEEIDQLFAWHQQVLGACNPFWLPSFQRDLVPLAVIGSADTVFNIQARDYTTFEFPDSSRRTIGFVFSDTDVTRRTILNAVDNGDGTETITIDQPLLRTFTQRRDTGISFCWRVRCADDTLSFEWRAKDCGTATLQVIELRDSVFIDQWEVYSLLSDGVYSVDPSGYPVIVTAQFLGSLGHAGGYWYIERLFQLVPDATVNISGTYQISANPSPWITGLQFHSALQSTNVYATNPPSVLNADIPFSVDLALGTDGMLRLRLGRFDLEYLVGPVTVRLTSLVFAPA